VSITVATKQDLLVSFVQSIFDAHNADFTVYTDPVYQLMRAESRLARRIAQGDTDGETPVRMCTVYWVGPDDASQIPGGNDPALLRMDGAQIGGVDRFRIALHWEWDSGTETPGSGSFQAWKDLIYGDDPPGLIRVLRGTSTLDVTSGDYAGDIVWMSVPTEAQFPRQPVPLQGLGIERAHYGEFVVRVTDDGQAVDFSAVLDSQTILQGENT